MKDAGGHDRKPALPLKAFCDRLAADHLQKLRKVDGGRVLAKCCSEIVIVTELWGVLFGLLLHHDSQEKLPWRRSSVAHTMEQLDHYVIFEWFDPVVVVRIHQPAKSQTSPEFALLGLRSPKLTAHRTLSPEA